jgi:hypothetical protein
VNKIRGNRREGEREREREREKAAYQKDAPTTTETSAACGHIEGGILVPVNCLPPAWYYTKKLSP